VSSADTAALVALLRAGRRPPGVYADLVEEAGSAQAVLENEQPLLAADLIQTAAAEVRQWTERDVRLVTVLDRDYPENLRAVHDRPPLLFLSGRLEPGDIRSVAIIGSRKASPAGRERAHRLSTALIDAGYTIVSGLAAGIDTAAHVTALERGARTIAVIGTGLQHAYPPQNSQLQRQIAADGVVISQFWPETRASRETFPLRNAVMSGVSLATVVVEATVTSGARIQARHALKHGRPVLIAASLLEQDWAAELAVRPGVHVFRSAEEVIAVVERLSSAGTLLA
jgi:DNA processing protein